MIEFYIHNTLTYYAKNIAGLGLGLALIGVAAPDILLNIFKVVAVITIVSICIALFFGYVSKKEARAKKDVILPVKGWSKPKKGYAKTATKKPQNDWTRVKATKYDLDFEKK